jgi:hypothetical protein
MSWLLLTIRTCHSTILGSTIVVDAILDVASTAGKYAVDALLYALVKCRVTCV